MHLVLCKLYVDEADSGERALFSLNLSIAALIQIKRLNHSHKQNKAEMAGN